MPSSRQDLTQEKRPPTPPLTGDERGALTLDAPARHRGAAESGSLVTASTVVRPDATVLDAPENGARWPLRQQRRGPDRRAL